MSISEAIVDSISGNIEELRKENIELSKQLKDVREEYEELFLSHENLGKILENRDKEKAEAIMGLVELMVGAFVSGFVDKNNPTISEIYQVARNHVKDNYGIDYPSVVEAYGADTAIKLGLNVENMNPKTKH